MIDEYISLIVYFGTVEVNLTILSMEHFVILYKG